MLKRPLAVPALLTLTALTLTALTMTASAEAHPPPLAGVRVANAWPGYAFKEPVHVTYAPGAPNREYVYVVQQSGQVVRAQKWRGVGPVPRPTMYASSAL